MKYIIFPIIIFSLLCCNSSETKTKAVATSKVEENSITGSDNGTATQIQVTLSGGANPGTYKATSREPTCSMGLTGGKSFGNQYSETGKGEKELSSVQLIADNYEDAKDGTANFNAQFGLGSLLGGPSYSLDPNKNSGKGKLTLTESDGAKTVTVEGITKEGVGIKAIITCRTVQKIVNGQLKDE